MDALEEIHGITTQQERALPTRAIGRHRITQRAWQALTRHHHGRDLVGILTEHADRFAPIAHSAYHQRCILVTNYDFVATIDDEVLWYRPNQHGSITISLRGEY